MTNIVEVGRTAPGNFPVMGSSDAAEPRVPAVALEMSDADRAAAIREKLTADLQPIIDYINSQRGLGYVVDFGMGRGPDDKLKLMAITISKVL